MTRRRILQSLLWILVFFLSVMFILAIYNLPDNRDVMRSYMEEINCEHTGKMNLYENPITGKLNALDPENPEPGIYAGVPHDEYLKIHAISRSRLVQFMEAPERFLYPEDSNKDHFTFGTQYHAYIMEPDTFKQEFVEGIVTATGRRGKEFREQQEQHGYDKVYKPSDLEKYEAMKEALARYPRSHAILSNDNPKEIVIIFLHEESGLLVKVKIDSIINDAGWLIDLKTTRSAVREDFKWSIKKYKYDLQSGFYVNACIRTPGLEHINNFAIIAQEKEHPYIVRGYNMQEYVADAIVDSDRELCRLADWIAQGCPLPDGMQTEPKYSL